MFGTACKSGSFILFKILLFMISSIKPGLSGFRNLLDVWGKAGCAEDVKWFYHSLRRRAAVSKIL